uniref:Uncharacterized protein n=1 Tax=Oryza brachyantha TaxID=4533 RepID=J3MTD4_ORYBR
MLVLCVCRYYTDISTSGQLPADLWVKALCVWFRHTGWLLIGVFNSISIFILQFNLCFWKHPGCTLYHTHTHKTTFGFRRSAASNHI